jgi:hypothetical protein
LELERFDSEFYLCFFLASKSPQLSKPQIHIHKAEIIVILHTQGIVYIKMMYIQGTSPEAGQNRTNAQQMVAMVSSNIRQSLDPTKLEILPRKDYSL